MQFIKLRHLPNLIQLDNLATQPNEQAAFITKKEFKIIIPYKSIIKASFEIALKKPASIIITISFIIATAKTSSINNLIKIIIITIENELEIYLRGIRNY